MWGGWLCWTLFLDSFLLLFSRCNWDHRSFYFILWSLGFISRFLDYILNKHQFSVEPWMVSFLLVNVDPLITHSVDKFWQQWLLKVFLWWILISFISTIGCASSIFHFVVRIFYLFGFTDFSQHLWVKEHTDKGCQRGILPLRLLEVSARPSHLAGHLRLDSSDDDNSSPSSALVFRFYYAYT